MRKLLQSRKGLDEDFTDIIVGSLFVLLIFLFFFFFITRLGVRFQDSIDYSIETLNKNTILLAYLRTPLEQGGSVATFLGGADSDKVICNEPLPRETKNFLSAIPTWYFNFEDHCYLEECRNNPSPLSGACQIYPPGGRSEGETVMTMIPTLYPHILVEVDFIG